MVRRSVVCVLLVATACSSSATTDDEPAVDAAGGDGDAAKIDGSTVDATDAPSDAAPDATTETSAEAGVLDCTWVNDPNNCWRTFVAAVDACLGNPVASGVRGSLSADDKTCTYPSGGRTVAYAIAPQPDGGPDRADRDFVARNGGKDCLHYVERAAVTAFSATGPVGTMQYVAVGNDVTVTCPDGSRFEGDALAVAKLCGPAVFAGGSPDHTVVESGGIARFQLSGMKDVVYACVAAGGAGP